MYGSADAADALMAYNGFNFSKSDPIPGGTSVVLPYTLSGTVFDLKKGIARIPLFVLLPSILELSWKTKEIVAFDGVNDASRFAEITGKTASCPDNTPATLEIYQYDPNGSHTLIDSDPSCKIVKNELAGADGKPRKIWLEWHSTMYDWKRPYYFCKLLLDKLEYVMPLKPETMLRLKQYHYLVNDPAANFDAEAGDECAKAKSIIESKGGIWDFFFKKNTPAQHYVNSKDGKKDGVAGLRTGYLNTIDRGVVYINYLSSHGVAFCSCDGTENRIKEFPNEPSKDGVIEWLCPVCKKSSNAFGVFCFENNTYIKPNDVHTLAHGPKLLLIASCCSTAITDKMPNAWKAKGTRWYIGWAVPVAFSAAYNFSKAFYGAWCGKYNMDPEKVKSVFDSVSGSYWKWRPRLFGS
jgi:hypothetical protein